MKYTDEMTAACLGLTVEQYRAAYKDRMQGRMAVASVRLALAGRGAEARDMAQAREARVQSLIKKRGLA